MVVPWLTLVHAGRVRNVTEVAGGNGTAVVGCQRADVDVDERDCDPFARKLGYVDGLVRDTVLSPRDQWHGLGNILWMIAAAMRCPRSEPVLVRTKQVLIGTPIGTWWSENRPATAETYTMTLLRNFLSVRAPPRGVRFAPHIRRERYGCPAKGMNFAFDCIGRQESSCNSSDTSFVTRTYAQSSGFLEGVPRTLARLAWPDVSHLYQDIERGTCVCLRAAWDFKAWAVGPERYRAALDYLRSVGESVQPLFLVADHPEVWTKWQIENATWIQGRDVVQLAVARRCRNFVLSQSSFHLWLAYAAVLPRHVLVFNNTNPTKYGLHLTEAWMSAPWTVIP